jgi:hypothetical protein
LSTTQTIQDITINDEDIIPEFDYYKISDDGIPVEILMPNQFFQAYLLLFIYKQSIVNYEELYKMMALVAYKTSNNQEDCERMAYWKFENLMTCLNEIIEQENGEGGGKPHDAATKQFDEMKGSASNMMKTATPKMPKMSMPSMNFKTPHI